ncbi:MAG: helix-turn-helix transcriptional regulator [Proteobacteria bacterium]|nr:helix-turn-helix transcriptional regulator [Pseudomonadota bacterium]
MDTILSGGRDMTLGRELAAWRARLDWTQERAGAAAGVSRATIAAWEAGSNDPGAGRLAKLLAAYGVPQEQWGAFLELAGEEE